MKTTSLYVPTLALDPEKILKRFLRYASIGTPSDRHLSETQTPSTESQWKLIRLLEQEIMDMGVPSVEVTEHGFLIARIPPYISTLRKKNDMAVPVVAFIAHVDTASDVPGDPVRPMIHRNYDGKRIVLSSGIEIDPVNQPRLSQYIGDTIITSDGTTLLGADDKAGVAALVTALEYLMQHPEVEHGGLEFIFTPDEETGRGMERFPLDRVQAKVAYTLDGDGEGTVEYECFNAYRVVVQCKGVGTHLGYARGKLVNAVTMAASFVSFLPRSESPEATDGRFGYYCPLEINGNITEAKVEIFLRDYEMEEIKRRLQTLESIAKAIEGIFPGGKVTLISEKQYLNMRDAFAQNPQIVQYLDEAIRATGIEPVHTSIRGGTDGARLTELGIPTPNMFAGGSNFHSLTEWVPLSAMVRATEVVIHLVQLWAKG
ncbi:MAG: peptidase T [Spirochaetes bacterium]|nr:peptidase T [Spirochaetota bacterium]